MLVSDFKTDDFLGEICESYYNDVYEFCVHLVNNNRQFYGMAEDCTQETFLIAGRQTEKLKSHPSIKGWLFLTAKHLVQKSFRSYEKRRKNEVLTEHLSILTSPCKCGLDSAFESFLDIHECKAEILMMLKEEEYRLYIDYFALNKSVDQIAAANHISYTATTSRICRLRKKIQSLIFTYIGDSFD
ncbi:RNA polymerase sigma factor [Paenibacillus thiaminolyticus]|uniref:Sigma-70 family RNA polymerase sigma factor n=1 Tax=Paenibacillus thiaminolyticus TaxID=49283 RepID=A0A3A3G9P6_PANTH|nr:sigma-70 family RNA polymerase sigma factor [Paenibacillus thiaminolyticus]RJG17762.1 sigma-70 family RNA polymerase sigma factor [Paenibacillus thiaminolyticus]